MHVPAVLLLGALFLVGALLGLVLGVIAFAVAVLRRGRPVHHDGVVLSAEVIPRDQRVGPRLAGRALVRFSGALADQDGASDILGVLIRWLPAAAPPRPPAAASSTDDDAPLHDEDPEAGDQDVLLGTFEAFHTAARDRARTNAGDYLANHYSTVTPWWVLGVGPSTLRLRPAHGVSDRRDGDGAPAEASGPDASASPANAAASRLQRLDTAIAAGRAAFIMSLDRGKSSTEIAELRLTAASSLEGRLLRASMFRTRRKLLPVGFRNGIRATLYPLSQLGRRLRQR
jgi:hypothetical protein